MSVLPRNSSLRSKFQPMLSVIAVSWSWNTVMLCHGCVGIGARRIGIVVRFVARGDESCRGSSSNGCRSACRRGTSARSCCVSGRFGCQEMPNAQTLRVVDRDPGMTAERRVLREGRQHGEARHQPGADAPVVMLRIGIAPRALHDRVALMDDLELRIGTVGDESSTRRPCRARSPSSSPRCRAGSRDAMNRYRPPCPAASGNPDSASRHRHGSRGTVSHSNSGSGGFFSGGPI